MITGWLMLANQRVLLTFVYAKCTYAERRALWADLGHSQMNDCPWMVLSDFNTIRMDSERIGGHLRPLISIYEFTDCLDKCGLFHLSSSGQASLGVMGMKECLGARQSWIER